MPDFGKFSTPGLEGSGPRAIQENEKALSQARAELKELSEKLSRGEIDVNDPQFNRIRRLIRSLEEDKGRIISAGM